MSNSIFVIAMNEAKYNSLPPDIKKVIDANSGLEWSKQIGKVFDGTTAPGRKLAADAGGVFDTLTQAEYDRWVKANEAVNKEWVDRDHRQGRQRRGAAQRRQVADQEVRRLKRSAGATPRRGKRRRPLPVVRCSARSRTA